MHKHRSGRFGARLPTLRDGTRGLATRFLNRSAETVSVVRHSSSSCGTGLTQEGSAGARLPLDAPRPIAEDTIAHVGETASKRSTGPVAGLGFWRTLSHTHLRTCSP